MSELERLMIMVRWALGLGILATALSVSTCLLFARAKFQELDRRAVEKKQGHERLLQRLSIVPDPQMRAELVDLLTSQCADPVLWLETPNAGFGDRPQALIEQGRADLILDRLRAIRYGAFS